MYAQQESAQWCWKLIQTELLCARTIGSNSVVIGMIDGTVDGRHPDFIGSDIRVLPGGSRSVCQRDQSEACQHGTFVAGILAAQRGSLAPALSPGCRMLSISLFCEADTVDDCPRVRPAEVARAIRIAMDEGARIINLSLGLLNPKRPDLAELIQIYEQARARGVLIIAAGGNQGESGVNPLFEHDWVIPVAACDAKGRLAANSNAGGRLTHGGLLAPGSQIYSTAPGGGYTKMSGTSVAAPFVSGVLALLWTLFPQAPADVLRTAMLRPYESRIESIPPLLNSERSFNFLAAQFGRHALRKDTRVMVSSALQEKAALAGAHMPTVASVSGLHDDAEIEAHIPSASMPPVSEHLTGTSSVKRNTVIPQGNCACGNTGINGFVYVIGTIKPVFPTVGLRNEYLAAAKALQKPEQDYYDVFSNPAYRYITELMCWVLEIDNVDVYVVKPRSGLELSDIVLSLKPPPSNSTAPYQTLIGVIGTLGAASSPATCGGLILPQVTANQIFHFTIQDLINKLKGNSIDVQAIRDLLEQMIQRPNNGSTPGERAINFVALRYPEVFKKHAQLTSTGVQPNDNAYFLVSVRTRPSPSSGNRVIQDVVFQYQKFSTSEQEFFYVSIDVSGQFPFVNTPMRPFMTEM